MAKINLLTLVSVKQIVSCNDLAYSAFRRPKFKVCLDIEKSSGKNWFLDDWGVGSTIAYRISFICQDSFRIFRPFGNFSRSIILVRDLTLETNSTSKTESIGLQIQFVRHAVSMKYVAYFYNC